MARSAHPFSLRSICGLQTNEQPRTQADTRLARPSVSGVSPVFAGLRGSLTNRGERFTFRVLWLARANS